MAAWRELEILVSKIQKQLAPNAEVLHDTRLPGRKSKRDRQIDVLVREKIGQYEMLIVLECKDSAKPVDVKGVEEFYGLLDDVGANKGVMVCPNGFTNAAKERANGLQLDLYSPVDTDPHKWQVHVHLPMVCDFRSAGMAFAMSGTGFVPRQTDFHKCSVFSRDKKLLGNAFCTAMEKWTLGLYPTAPGQYENQPIFEEPSLIDGGHAGKLVEVQLTVGLLVKRQLYFGRIPLKTISGFKDEISGNLITNAFTTGILDPNVVAKDWLPISSEDQLPLKPVLRLTGLVGWED